jgi:hypothetical protein
VLLPGDPDPAHARAVDPGGDLADGRVHRRHPFLGVLLHVARRKPGDQVVRGARLGATTAPVVQVQATP